MKYVIFDTETTSLKPGQIAQLTYVIVDTSTGKAKGKNFYFSVNSMDSSAEKIHKLSRAKLQELSQGRIFQDDAEEIFEDFARKIWLGHNVKFDINFLTTELERNQMYYEKINSFCTMNHFKDIMKLPSGRRSGYKNPKLEELVNFMGITPDQIEKTAVKLFGGFSGYHDARYDVAATALVFLNGIKRGMIHDYEKNA